VVKSGVGAPTASAARAEVLTHTSTNEAHIDMQWFCNFIKLLQISVVKRNRQNCTVTQTSVPCLVLRLFAFEQQGWRKISVLHNSERCNGCAICAEQCVIDAIAMDEKAASQHCVLRSPSVFHDDPRVRYFVHSNN
jgi:Pyruvate/2-oxoacid:ferredoxin oxidoreductase delta subunit